MESGGELKIMFFSVADHKDGALDPLLVCTYLTAGHSHGGRCRGAVDFQVSQSTYIKGVRCLLTFQVVNQRELLLVGQLQLRITFYGHMETTRQTV